MGFSGKKFIIGLFAAAFIFSALPVPAAASGQVATEGERAPQQEVGSEDMAPITGDMVNDGSYSIDVDSSSSMFRVTKCELRAFGGELTARMTLGGTGYLRLFMGSGEEAAAAKKSECSGYEEGPDGSYSYTVAVPALDEALDCAGFSRRKKKWYPHKIVFLSKSLPAGALKSTASAAYRAAVQKEAPVPDGSYTASVSMEGGSGRASIESPAEVSVKGGLATAKVVWSSPHYDYMVVNGEKLLPLGGDGNSAFEIPVLAFDEPFAVVADTTAMSEPHEIEYRLTFDSKSLSEADGGPGFPKQYAADAIAILLAALIALFMVRRRKNEGLPS